jgi:hypothetical protein
VQFDAQKLQKGQGSGLGLWISQRIVDLHGGRIGCISAGEGNGSTFFIEIPVYAKERFNVGRGGPLDSSMHSVASAESSDQYAHLKPPTGRFGSFMQTSRGHPGGMMEPSPMRTGVNVAVRDIFTERGIDKSSGRIPHGFSGFGNATNRSVNIREIFTDRGINIREIFTERGIDKSSSRVNLAGQSSSASYNSYNQFKNGRSYGDLSDIVDELGINDIRRFYPTTTSGETLCSI